MHELLKITIVKIGDTFPESVHADLDDSRRSIHDVKIWTQCVPAYIQDIRPTRKIYA